MEALYQLWLAHPSAAWIALGVVLLAVEAISGSGWLLWPAAAALVPALVSLVAFRGAVGVQWILFAVTAIALTWVGRRYLRTWPRTPHDINDPRAAVIGQLGEVTSVTSHGQCRVQVGGKEWAAESDGSEPLAGQRVKVTAVIGGARLQVTPAR